MVRSMWWFLASIRPASQRLGDAAIDCGRLEDPSPAREARATSPRLRGARCGRLLFSGSYLNLRWQHLAPRKRGEVADERMRCRRVRGAVTLTFRSHIEAGWS